MSPEDPGPEPAGPETMSQFYTIWDGSFSRFTCNGEPRPGFRGVQATLWGRLEGTVTIDAVSDQQVSGSFELRGQGDEETTTYDLKPTRDARCPWAGDMVPEIHPVPISASGSFTAPNVSRPVVFLVAGIGRAVPVGR